MPAPSLPTLVIYWTATAAGWIALTALAVVLAQRDKDLGAPGRSIAASVWIMLLTAAALRLAVVFTTTPTLSDDIWRYIHDGVAMRRDGNPYAVSPAERWPKVPHVERINHPHLVTIYQATSQWVFAGVAHHDHTGMRLTFVLFDLWIVALVLWKLVRDGRSVWWAALYAWHPLAVSEVAWSGHQDVIGIAWMLMALTLVDLQRAQRAGSSPPPPPEVGWASRLRACSPVLAGGAMGLAIGVKPIVAPVALVLAASLGKHAKPQAAFWGALMVTLALLYVPFAMMEGGLGRMLDTVYAFTTQWRFNGPVHDGLAAVVGATAARPLLAAAALIVLGLACVRGWETWRGAHAFLLAMLVVSSTVYPWYLLWVLPWAVVQLQRSGAAWAVWVLSLTLGWTYEVWLHADQWRVPGWLLAAVWVPGAVAWVVWKGGGGAKGQAAVRAGG